MAEGQGRPRGEMRGPERPTGRPYRAGPSNQAGTDNRGPRKPDGPGPLRSQQALRQEAGQTAQARTTTEPRKPPVGPANQAGTDITGPAARAARGRQRAGPTTRARITTGPGRPHGHGHPRGRANRAGTNNQVAR